MIRIVYHGVSAGMKENLVPLATDIQPFCDLTELKRNSLHMKNYATLEENYWRLDGSHMLIDDTSTHLGFWSESMSDSDGVFSAPPVLVRRFSRLYNAPVISFVFDNHNDDYCSELTITWYIDDVEIAQHTYYPNAPQFNCTLGNGDGNLYFDRIEIAFIKTNKPFRYVKIAAVDDGSEVTLDGERLNHVHIVENMSLIGEELAIGTLEMEVDTSGELQDYEFKKRQPLEVYHDDDYIGLFFVSDTKKQAASVDSISAEDYVGILDKTTFYGGMYDEYPLVSLISDILGNVPYTIAPELAGVQITGYLPISTCRVALARVAFASCAIISTHRRDDVYIGTLSSQSEQLTEDSVYEGAGIAIEDTVTAVELTVYSFRATDELIELYNGSITDGETIIKFSSPVHGIEVQGDGVEIVQSSVNHVVLRCFSSGQSIVVTGKKYKEHSFILSKANSDVEYGTDDNKVSSSDVKLIHTGNARQVLDHISAHYMRPRTYEADILSSASCGKIVVLPNPYAPATTVSGRIEQVDISTFNQHIESVVLRLE